jgi:hypothetical protein
VEVDNSLPLQVALKINLQDGNRRDVLTLPQSDGDSLHVAAGVVSNGDVVSSAKSVLTIDLQKSEIDQFNLADFVKLAVGVATPAGGPVNFRTTDKVRVRVWTHFSYGVNQ